MTRLSLRGMQLGVPTLPIASVSSMPLALDSLTTALAVSTRKLRTEYAGDCVLLRRSSDDAEQAFGFNAESILDTAAISAWGGEDSLYVKVWYDQSGNGYDATQATAGSQPTLLLNGRNGLPVVRFADGQRLAISGAISNNTPALHVFAVAKYPLTGSSTLLYFSTGGNANSSRFQFGAHTTATQAVIGGRRNDADALTNINGGSITGSGSNQIYVLQDGYLDFANSNAALSIDGIQQNSTTNFLTDGNTPATDSAAAWIGGNNGAISYFRGDVGELIVSRSVVDESARQPLLAKIRTAWGFGTIRGAWTWFNDPRAVALGEDVLFGVVSPGGDINAALYDASEADYNTYLVRQRLEVDDHDNPSFLVRTSDSRILCFYSAHNANDIYLKISTNANDPSAWDAQTGLDSQIGLTYYSYTNPIQLPGEMNDPIYLFFRAAPSGTARAGYYSKSEDGGETWSVGVNWISNGVQRPYWRFITNGDDRIDFIVSDGSPADVSGNSVYAGYYTGGNWYKSDGTLVGDVDDMPFAPSDFTRIYDGTTVKGWIWDIAIGTDGHPRILYVVFNSTSDHRYWYARWTGTEWATTQICAAGKNLYAGELYYSGGIAFDHADPDTVFASRESGSAWNIWRYVTGDDGATWTGTQLTTGSGTRIRPVIARNASGEPKLLYIEGTYTSYTNYDTKVTLRSSS